MSNGGLRLMGRRGPDGVKAGLCESFVFTMSEMGSHVRVLSREVT